MKAGFCPILDRVCSHAIARPQAIALVCDGDTTTFAELTGRAVVLASALEALLNGKRHSVVAVCTDNAQQLATSALAAWMSGCAYLPLSPAHPAERLRHILTEADVPVVLFDSAADSAVPSGGWKQIALQQVTAVPLPAFDISQLSRAGITPQDPAYVIYTSGSTGNPKGAVVTHANLSNLITWYADAFAVTSTDRATQIRGLTSDVAVMELWGPLSQGASVHAVDRATSLVPEHLRDYLIEHEITICEAPSLIAEQLVTLDWPSETKLRYLQTGGETLRVFPPSPLPFQLVNNYGPTECTVVTTSAVVSAGNGHSLPAIGFPISGAEVFILNSDLQPVPDGDLGEIFIAGAGVAAGYVGRPDLTSERFLAIPSLPEAVRAYRTGDLGRKLANGEYEFCGRADDQIKLRGFRIEPAEIVSRLRSHPAVSAAAVTTIGEAAHKQLVGYVTLKVDTSSASLQEHLAALLPDYMVPVLFVRLDSMPLTSHGKIDASALPFPNRSNLLELATSSLEPMTEIQIEVASVLASVLKRPDVGFTDNFFRLGGNSLLAAQVVVNVQRSFGVNLPVRSVFESPTVQGLAAEIEKKILAESSSVTAPELTGTSVAYGLPSDINVLLGMRF